MLEVTVDELFGQLRDVVDVLASAPPWREQSTIDERIPLEELTRIIDEAVPAWFPRLVAAGLLTAEAQAALRSLKAALLTLREDEYVAAAGERTPRLQWQRVRHVARQARAALAGWEPRAPIS